MSLSDLASLGSFVSGVAVLVSLVFLFFQMRQTSRQAEQTQRIQQSLIKQGRTARAIEIQLRASDPAFAQVLARVLYEPESLSPADSLQFFAWSRCAFINHEEAFTQRSSGLLDDRTFEDLHRILRSLMTIPAQRVAWRRAKEAELFDEGYCAFVDSILKETRVRKMADLDQMTRLWKSDIAAEFAKVDQASAASEQPGATASRAV